jgi:hypothetical protein
VFQGLRLYAGTRTVSRQTQHDDGENGLHGTNREKKSGAHLEVLLGQNIEILGVKSRSRFEIRTRWKRGWKWCVTENDYKKRGRDQHRIEEKSSLASKT